MRDVARLAGVSVSTVSAVINGVPKVSEKRARKVRDAMEALDYHPDQVARSLKVGRTNTIGLVIPDVTNAFYASLIRGVEEAARAAGYGVLLCDSNEDPEQERRHLSTLFSRRVDGVLLTCSDNSSAYDSLIRRRFPLVFVDRLPAGLKESAISSDNVDAAELAARHLVELGHSRIAFLAGKLSLSPFADRLEGFRRAMQQARLIVPPEYVCPGDLEANSGYLSSKALLALGEPPTAVIASNNLLLSGLLRALRELGIACPADLSIVGFDGFDDYVWNEHVHPKLTVVVQPIREMGYQAFTLLHAKMAPDTTTQAPSTPGVVLLKTELKVRDSTARPSLTARA